MNPFRTEQRCGSNGDRRLRVLAFAPSLGGGGAEMSLLRLVNQLDRDTFDPEVAVGRGGGAYEADLSADVPLSVLCVGDVWSSTGRLLRAILPLRRLIQRSRPDVIVSVMDHANVALMLAVFGLKERPEIVLSVQNNPKAKYTGKEYQPINRAVFFLMKHFYARADRIVAISQGVEAELTEMIPGLQGYTEVIHNAGVDDTVRRKARRPIGSPPSRAPGEKVVLACGRLIEQKGFSYLLDAFAQIQEEIAAQLWILGEGDKRRKLEDQARRLDISENVWMPGFVENPYQYMDAADVFVLSSLWEGFGNVVAEALACGAPVITTDCPHGPAEIVEGGKSGLLVPPADVEALVGAMRRMLTDEALRNRFEEAGKERAKDFTAEHICKQYEGLFQRLVH